GADPSPAGGGTRGGPVQNRSALGPARCALPCLCRATPSAARGLRARGSGVNSSGSNSIEQDSIPRLGIGVRTRFDPARQQWLVLAPERLFVPDEIAFEII